MLVRNRLILLAGAPVLFGFCTGINLAFFHHIGGITPGILSYSLSLGMAVLETVGLLELVYSVLSSTPQPMSASTTASTELQPSLSLGSPSRRTPQVGRLISVDGSALAGYRKKKGWSPEKLAGEAGQLSVGIVLNAEQGKSIEPKFVTKIAEALGVPPFAILPAKPSASLPAPKEQGKKRCVVRIILEATSESFQQFLQHKDDWVKRLFTALQNDGILTSSPHFLNVVEGSICIIADVDVKDAHKIERAWRRRELAYLGINKVKLPFPLWAMFACVAALLLSAGLVILIVSQLPSRTIDNSDDFSRTLPKETDKGQVKKEPPKIENDVTRILGDKVSAQLQKLGDPTLAPLAKAGGVVLKVRKTLKTELHMGADTGFLVGVAGREFVYAPSGTQGFGSNLAKLKVWFCEWDSDKKSYKTPVSVTSIPSIMYPGFHEYKAEEDAPGVFVVVVE